MGGLVRKLLVVLFVCIAFCANARVLHVGDNTIKLSQTKTTDPALHVRVGDELWYGAMCTNFNLNSLHIKYNDKVYDVIEPFTDTTNYTYDENGRLIAANENIYLESTGTQWIDTYYWPIAGTSMETEGKVTKIGKNQNFAGTIGSRKTGNFVRAPQMYFGPLTCDKYGNATYLFNDYHVTNVRISINDRVYGYISVNPENTSAISIIKNLTSQTEKQTEQLGYIDAETTLPLFAACSHNGVTNKKYCAELLYGKMYYAKIWDNDVLVRHFVPVPCGLQIGDFVVPSNGMWDIVEQKFYGNMGTGDFIYGVDE